MIASSWNQERQYASQLPQITRWYQDRTSESKAHLCTEQMSRNKIQLDTLKIIAPGEIT